VRRLVENEGSAGSSGWALVLFCANSLGQHTAKQLLLRDAYSDIAQKHRVSKFIFTTDHRGRVGPNDDGETEMANVAFTCPSKIREQTVKARIPRRIEHLLQLWRRACILVAEWHSRALQRESLAQLNGHLLADIGLTREKQIVEVSKLFCWFP
jgi:uncharacterized protein YjiS (DUF1127 family)